MKKIFFNLFFCSFFCFYLILFPFVSFAEEGGGGFFPDKPTPLSGLEEIQKNVGDKYMPSTDPILWIIRVFNYLLTFLGVVFLIMIIYGGYTWMTAGGNEEKVKKGKGILTTAVIGLTIVVLARVFSIFLQDRLRYFTR